MNAEDAYRIWAPDGAPYSPWVKPVVFASETDWSSAGRTFPEIAEPSWLRADEPTDYRSATAGQPSRDRSTAYVLDLPGPSAVGWGVVFARMGWRPIALYNAVPGGVPAILAPRQAGSLAAIPFTPPDFSSLVDMRVVIDAMRAATPVLGGLALGPERPPVFLLDADRRFGHGGAIPGRFDNRSISLPTDFPSAVFLRARGIERVVLLQENQLEPQEDLAHTLLGWQQGGLQIQAKSLALDAGPEAIVVARPSHFRAVWYRLLATLGMTRSPLGGFGGTIPVPSAG